MSNGKKIKNRFILLTALVSALWRLSGITKHNIR
nr:MAG TPA: hypothetical protein [Caudoviricetes sp.]